MNNWNYIDTYNQCPAPDYIHCDTRDFHILCTDGDRADKRRMHKALQKLGDVQEAMFCQDEILGWLKSLEMNSGGRGEWRYLSFKGLTIPRWGNWIKYIRLIRTNEIIEKFGQRKHVYIAYLTCSNEPIALLKRDQIIPENIDQEALNFIECRIYDDGPDPEPKVVTCKTMDDLEKLLND